MSTDRKLGRPRTVVQTKGSYVTTWVPVELHDQLARTAAVKAVTVSALVRRVLSAQRSFQTKK